MMGLPQSWRPVSHEQGDTAVHVSGKRSQLLGPVPHVSILES